ncbi:FmdB family zinc ribbon protein [Novosphingobium sp. Rr 2-17]|uniref:FmdB family zinc ribbon protein n=1 Tax=Novosphingobium sp. Rr 2-17 TaxID=555793 RepID=UPI000A04704A
MPLYDYRCPACASEFELLIRTADQPACPTCGTNQIVRLISRVAPAGRAKEAAKAMRERARREGHTSNF